MLFNFKKDPHFYYRRFFHAPDDGSDDGGGGSDDTPPADDSPPPDPKVKTFTEKDVNAREAALRRRYDREIKELKHKYSTRDTEIEDLKSKIAAMEGGGNQDNSSEPRDTEGRIELLEKRWARTEEDLNSKIKAAEKIAQEERERRLSLEREQLLRDALVAAGIDDKKKKAAERYFAPQIKWDTIDEAWAYETENGNLVPIVDGVSEELPDIFKPSKMKRGGSGSSTGSPGAKVRKHKELEIEEKKLAEIKRKVASSGGRSASMLEFTRQKRRVNELRAELGSSRT